MNRSQPQLVYFKEPTPSTPASGTTTATATSAKKKVEIPTVNVLKRPNIHVTVDGTTIMPSGEEQTTKKKKKKQDETTKPYTAYNIFFKLEHYRILYEKVRYYFVLSFALISRPYYISSDLCTHFVSWLYSNRE